MVGNIGSFPKGVWCNRLESLPKCVAEEGMQLYIK